VRQILIAAAVGLSVTLLGTPIAIRLSQFASIASELSTPCTSKPASSSGTSNRPEPAMASSTGPASRGRRAAYHATSASPARGLSAS